MWIDGELMHGSQGWTSPYGPSDYISLMVRLFFFFILYIVLLNTTLAWPISMASFPSPSHNNCVYPTRVVRHLRYPHARCTAHT